MPQSVHLGDPWDRQLDEMVAATELSEECILRQAVITLYSLYIGATRVENNQLESSVTVDPATVDPGVDMPASLAAGIPLPQQSFGEVLNGLNAFKQAVHQEFGSLKQDMFDKLDGKR